MFKFLYVNVNTTEMLMHFFILNSGDRVSSDSSDSEMEDRTTSNVSLLQLDEWLHLKLDSEVCNLSLPCLFCVEEYLCHSILKRFLKQLDSQKFVVRMATVIPSSL